MDKKNIYEKLKEVLEEKAALGVAEAIVQAVESSERRISKEEFDFIKETMRKILKLHEENGNKISELLKVQKDIAKSLDSFKKLTEENFNKVWKSINELTEAHKKSEERLTRLERVVEELAEAQKRTEERVNELAEAQKKAEERLTRLERVVEELAEAQKRTEERVNELTEAHKKSEERLTRLERVVEELAEAQKKAEERLTRLEKTVEKLVEAQKKTEESINRLTLTVEDLKTQVGGHSHTIGHILEDKAIAKLPKILKKRFNFEIDVPLKRGYLENDKGLKEEVNIFGFAKKNGVRFLLLGEGKTRFSKKDLNDFQEKIRRFEKKYENIFPFIVTYILSSAELEEEIKEKGIQCFLSFEFER